MPAPDRPPSFPMYPHELLGDEHVVAMDALAGNGRHVAFAGYLRLLLKLWMEPEPGRIRADDDRLARLSGLGNLWPKYRDVIAKCFELRDGWWVQKRMVRERQLQINRYKKAVEAGSKGGRKAKQTRRVRSNPIGTLQPASRVPVGSGTPGGLSPARGVRPIPDPDPGPDPEKDSPRAKTELSAGPGSDVPAGTDGLRTTGETKPGDAGTVDGMSSIGEVLKRVMPQGMPRNLGAVTGADLDTPEGRERERQAQLDQLHQRQGRA